MSKFLPFDQALAFALALGLVTQKEWTVWCKEGLRPPNVPADPCRVYKDGGWQGWGHWLGTGNTKPGTQLFLPFGEALAGARSLNLASLTEWQAWCKEGRRPPNVPSNPNAIYKDGGWQGWGHWLGTSTRSSKAKKYQFLPFDEALALARSLGLASSKEWKVWCKGGTCPPNVPSNPQRTYKDGGWQGWGHWLGTDNSCGGQKRDFLPFDEALRVARSLQLLSHAEWRAWCRTGVRPANVPSNPDQVYVHGGWRGWEHWLQHANINDAAPAPAAARPAGKRAAPAGCAGTAPDKGRGKRRRR